MFEAVETCDLDGLQEMFTKNGLEVSRETGTEISFVKCWEIRADEADIRIAGLRLEKRGGEFVIVGIYVDDGFRSKRLGSLLLDAAINETKRLGGKRILLVAKAPGFFKKAGFIPADVKEFEGIINCGSCMQLNNNCTPMFMCLEL